MIQILIPQTLRERLDAVLRLPLLGYQRKGVRFVEKAGGRALICDEMGLGKTAQSIAWAALHPEARPVVVVCQATMKWTWQREWIKFAGMQSYVCEGELSTAEEDRAEYRKTLGRIARRFKKAALEGMDSFELLKRRRRAGIKRAKIAKRRKAAKRLREARALSKQQIIIINFDILAGWLPFLLAINPKLLIIDECHHLRHPKTKRTKACDQLSKKVKHVISLSGTPIEGKPIEFFPVLKMTRPREFSSLWRFGFEHCSPVRNRWNGTWDFSGASNLDALHHRLKTVMIRRMKEDVWKQMPKKRYTVIPLSLANREDYDEAEENFLSWLRESKGNDAYLRARRAEAVVKLGHLKRLAAEGKMKLAIEWVREWLESNPGEKLLVVGIHKAIIRRLKEAFPTAVVIDGRTSNKVKKGEKVSPRQQAMDTFQTKKKIRLCIIQLKCAQGVTLTAAANVLKVELGWTPGEHKQAEDRVHRIGQTAKRVQIYYMVGRDTIEERILEVLQTKDKVTGRILDGRRGAVMKLLDMFLKEAA